MRFSAVFKSIFQDILLRKSRSFLTMLGIIIGVAAVIAIMAVGASAQDLLLSQIEALGSNTVSILPGASDEKGPPASALGIEVTTLKYDDALALKKISYLAGVLPMVSGRTTVSFFNKSNDFDYSGVGPDYLIVEDTKIKEGRFISQEDVNSLARVVVLGTKVKEELFGNDDSLGKRIKISQISFKVIGVMEERGMTGFQDKDNRVIVPIKSAQKMLLGIDHLTSINVKIDKEENIDRAIAQIKGTLRFRHGIKDASKDDFSVRSAAQALEALGTVTQGVKIFLGAVAAISLLVGGIGIMNIMFVVVNERTREIGLRKALGARRKNILLQFLMESATMTLIGGLLGIILGVLIALAVAIGARQFDLDWRFIVTSASILVSVSMAVSVGLIFGLWPANRASKLDPIKALRYE